MGLLSTGGHADPDRQRPSRVGLAAAAAPTSGEASFSPFTREPVTADALTAATTLTKTAVAAATSAAIACLSAEASLVAAGPTKAPRLASLTSITQAAPPAQAAPASAAASAVAICARDPGALVAPGPADSLPSRPATGPVTAAAPQTLASSSSSSPGCTLGGAAGSSGTTHGPDGATRRTATAAQPSTAQSGAECAWPVGGAGGATAGRAVDASPSGPQL
ncbi:hypothetical protein PLESTM_001353500 [Pleodorina starrii]|nr:hypothetical protein PLESTM_001353500 [Pleodorina starrii]